jgi:L-asparagine oxygenase
VELEQRLWEWCSTMRAVVRVVRMRHGGFDGLGIGTAMAVAMSQLATIRDLNLAANDAAVLPTWRWRLPPFPYDGDDGAYCLQVEERLGDLPRGLRELVTEFGESLGGAGVLRVRGLPVPDDLPPTPFGANADVLVPSGMESVLVAVGILVGEVLRFEHMSGGSPVHNVYIHPDDPTSLDAPFVGRLEMHTELPTHPQRPDALVLLCLRDGVQPPPPNFFSDARVAWDRLDESERTLLQESRFGLAGGGASVVVADPRPIVTEWRGAPRFSYTEHTLGSTPGHAQALSRLGDRIREATVETVLAPGDLVLIDNVHMVHGRGQQRLPRHDGTDRWLQRCYLRSLDRRHSRSSWRPT